MPTTHDYRRENLRKLIERAGGPGPLAKKLGYSNSSFLVQMAGPTPIRQVSEETARSYEKKLDLLPGTLDTATDIHDEQLIDDSQVKLRQANLYRKRKGLEPISDELGSQHNPDLMSREQLASLVSLVGKVCDEQHVNVPTSKFADIIALALLAKDDKKGNSEDYVKLLVSLTK
jgi:hypothetical protein